jgi:VWFA-related protein
MPRSIESGAAYRLFRHAVCLILAVSAPNFAYGQQPSQPPSTQLPAASTPTPQGPPSTVAPPRQASTLPADTPDAVFRITAQLVQADVIVVDRQGRFVDNLQQEQIELRVDDKPQPISFFERVRNGPLGADPPLSAEHPGITPPSPSREAAAGFLDRGRTVLFFVDDFHLAHGSLERARRVLAGFVESEMGLNDQAAIASTSGQTGFLQQLTGNKAVLRTALAGLRNRTPAAVDVELPPMTTHHADVLERGSDRELLAFFVRETQRLHPFLPRDAAESIVLGRANRIVDQSAAITLGTLSALERFVRSVMELPGRKAVFFISDGFLINSRASDASDRLQRIADAAARSRVVIYTMDARGLATQPGFDASRPAVFDPAGVVNRTDADELSSTQEPLYRLAADTGGRALVNSNALIEAVPRALREASAYYLLGWTPAKEEGRDNRFHRIEVSVRGRPEWIVRVPRGFYTAPPTDEQRTVTPFRGRRQSATPAATAAESPAEAALLSALRSTSPVTALPLSISLSFVDMPSTGAVVTASAQLNATTLDFGAADGSARQAIVDTISAVFDDQGQGVSTVKERLTVSPPTAPSNQDAMSNRVTYWHQFQVKPGLYQVRVAARDNTTGRVGSAMEWIEIPNLSGGSLSMSSLILGERLDAGQAETGAAASNPSMKVNANRRFRRDPHLRVLAYIYNAARSTAPPDVVVKIQVLHDEKIVIATPLSPLRTEEMVDLSRIPYFAELNMEGIPGGRYVLQVTAIDRAADSNASQRASFEIE